MRDVLWGVWHRALPPIALAMWWKRGAHARVHAIAADRAAGFAALLAARDPDQDRARDAAHSALTRARNFEIAAVCSAVPLSDPRTEEHARTLANTDAVLVLDLRTRPLPRDLEQRLSSTYGEALTAACTWAAVACAKSAPARSEELFARALAEPEFASAGVVEPVRALGAWSFTAAIRSEICDGGDLVIALQLAAEAAGATGLLPDTQDANACAMAALRDASRARVREDSEIDALCRDRHIEGEAFAMRVSRACASQQRAALLRALELRAIRQAFEAAEANARYFQPVRERHEDVASAIAEAEEAAAACAEPGKLELGRGMRLARKLTLLADMGGRREGRRILESVERARGSLDEFEPWHRDGLFIGAEGRAVEALALGTSPSSLLLASLAEDGHRDEVARLLPAALEQDLREFELRALTVALAAVEPTFESRRPSMIERALHALPGSDDAGAAAWLDSTGICGEDG